jgi:hypothetical protein
MTQVSATSRSQREPSPPERDTSLVLARTASWPQPPWPLADGAQPPTTYRMSSSATSSGSRHAPMRKILRRGHRMPRGRSSTPILRPPGMLASAKWPGHGGHAVLNLSRSDPALLRLADVVVTELLKKSTPDWVDSPARRRALIQAMERGMGIGSAD